MLIKAQSKVDQPRSLPSSFVTCMQYGSDESLAGPGNEANPDAVQITSRASFYMCTANLMMAVVVL